MFNFIPIGDVLSFSYYNNESLKTHSTYYKFTYDNRQPPKDVCFVFLFVCTTGLLCAASAAVAIAGSDEQSVATGTAQRCRVMDFAFALRTDNWFYHDNTPLHQDLSYYTADSKGCYPGSEPDEGTFFESPLFEHDDKGGDTGNK